MKKITIGIIAHVDSGKTTLSEALLYLSGSIRSFGRVDKGASFLDSDEMERRRGITIYSKQARFSFEDTDFVLIDTPGHADFSAETERTLGVLDYALLLISADDGIKGQTKILWKLLSEYKVPTFIFVNKMDRDGADRGALLAAVRELSDDLAVDFTDLVTDPAPSSFSEAFCEQVSVNEERAMEEYLETGTLSSDTVCRMIRERLLFPCLFGSALQMEGVEELLRLLSRFTVPGSYPEDFSARVYKVARDADGVRLTYVKITGGSLKTKSLLPDGERESKVNQIRFYSGEKYSLEETAFAGDVCVLTGLKESFAGQGYGADESRSDVILMPVLNYRVLAGDGADPVKILPVFKTLEEESPELSVYWDEEKNDIYVSVMGRVQLEILKSVLMERFSLSVSFDTGNVLYKETIAEPVIGVGHFEPLRHYAEVHLLLEPLPRGSGMKFESTVSSDRLAKNWQRLILTHLRERTHRGVLTGSPVTDIKITLVAGKAHLKHTEGGDFRQATYRAVRQGLMMAENLLLEPFYRFSMELPSSSLGRALTDLDQMKAEFSAPEYAGDGSMSVINGRGPVSALKDYPAELASYSKGLGSVSFVPDGYGPCHNAEEVVLEKNYDPERDLRNPADSVFCSGGSGTIVPYYEVYEHMHLAFDGSDNTADDPDLQLRDSAVNARTVSGIALGTEEVDTILRAANSSNVGAKRTKSKKKGRFGIADAGTAAREIGGKKVKISGLPTAAFAFDDADIILVDGYNVIFAWEELASLARDNIDSARDALIETLSKYRSMITGEVVAVFDAYKVKGRPGSFTDFQNIRIVYTAEDQTADQYIERFANENARKKKISVVTSDAVEQVVAMGQGCRLISSREFKNRIKALTDSINNKYNIR